MRSPQQQQAIDGVDDLVEYIEQLEQERDYLDGRCAELERYEMLNHEWVKEKVEGLNSFEEVEKMIRLADKINKQISGFACGWCDAKFYTKEQITKHLLKCNDNPLVKQIKELKLRLTEKDGDQCSF